MIGLESRLVAITNIVEKGWTISLVKYSYFEHCQKQKRIQMIYTCLYDTYQEGGGGVSSLWANMVENQEK